MKTAAQFGGPAQTGGVAASPTRIWVHLGTMLPCKHPKFGGSDSSCIAPILESHPGPLVAAGAAAGLAASTPGTIAAWPSVVVLSVPNTTGLVAMSAAAKCTGCLTNMAASVGFPWTTGRIIVSQTNGSGSIE